MKRFIVPVALSILLTFSTTAFAAEGSEVDAGITPDSILYPVDKLVEDVQLLVTTDPQKEAELLIDFAEERLSEAGEMVTAGETELVQDTINEYIDTINDATEAVSEVVLSDATQSEVKEELQTELQDAAQVNDNIAENLEEEQQQELNETKETVIASANVVKDIDKEVVKTLREKDLGYGQIAQIVLLAEKSGKTVEEVSAMFEGEEKGFGEVAKELGLKPSELKKNEKAKSREAEQKDENQEAADTSTDKLITAPQDTTKPAESKAAPAAIKKSDNKSSRDEKAPETIKSKDSENQPDSIIENDKKDSDDARDNAADKVSENSKDKGKETGKGKMK